MTLTLTSLAVALASGALAGCGGDSGDRLTKEEFVQQANAICEQGDEDIEAAGASVFATAGQPTQDELATFAKTVLVPTVRDELDQLRALSPPEDDEAQVDEIFDTAQAALDELEANPALVGEDTFAEVDRLAGAYGLSACAD